MTTADASAFDKLRGRIQALRAKTIDNGCTEGEALAAVLSGEILDAMTVAGVLRLHHMAVTGALAPDLASAVLATVVD